MIYELFCNQLLLGCPSAVAENQPAKKHRMHPELSNFAACLRELIEHPDFLTGESDLDRQFDSLALELFALQFKFNAAYRKICEARQLTPQTVQGWTQIPAVPTAAFKELELTSLAPAERTTVFHSSGTTEQKPSRHFHTVESMAVYEASLWQWFQLHFGDPGEFVFLTPNAAAAPHSSLIHMFDIVSRKTGGASLSLNRSGFFGDITADGTWTIHFDSVVKKLKSACDSGQPLTLLGTAFSFVHVLDFLAENNLQFQLPQSSRVMETGGYKNRSRVLPKVELHALIHERLGVSRENIICEYGMSELSSQAYDLEIQHPASSIQHRAFHFPPWARVQIISPETGGEVADGETGLIRIFDLANVFSVAAIQTEDLGVRRADGFELLGRAMQAEPRGCSLMTT